MKSKIPPLAFRVRPQKLDEMLGQEQAKGFIEDFIGGNRHSVILWGPPGSGKTSLANIIQASFSGSFHPISAVTSGVQELRKVTSMAENADDIPIVFIDEIHRFNKVQQDALLPFVENGHIILIGATTENPSFSVTSPLLSRIQVIVLKALEKKEIEDIITRAINNDKYLASSKKVLSDETVAAIAHAARGDARSALNLTELALTKIDKKVIDPSDMEELLKRPLYHDRAGENHYDLISAFHKSIRASDVDAGLYWLARMMEGGEDRLFILRRMIRIASEDIGMADPNALRVTTSAKEAFTFLGSPEGDLALYQTAVYLACAPKSNTLYLAEMKAKDIIKKTGTPPVPLRLRNAPTRLMKELEYSKGYIYAHDDPLGALSLNYLPDSLSKTIIYRPKQAGFEKRIKEILDAREKAKGDRTGPHRKTS